MNNSSYFYNQTHSPSNEDKHGSEKSGLNSEIYPRNHHHPTAGSIPPAYESDLDVDENVKYPSTSGNSWSCFKADLPVSNAGHHGAIGKFKFNREQVM